MNGLPKKYLLHSTRDRIVEIAIAIAFAVLIGISAWTWQAGWLRVLLLSAGTVALVYFVLFPWRIWAGAKQLLKIDRSMLALKSADLGDHLIAARDLRKTYKLGRVSVQVLHGVDLTIKKGEWVAILGASGSGKSTLLHLCGGLDRADDVRNGTKQPLVVFEGRDIGTMDKRELDRYRAREVGFVFQFYHLLPELSVLQNVTVGAMIRHGRLGYIGQRRQAEARASELLSAFGLDHRLRHRPAELSGGERQRVAIARALINGPRLLLADEPTGNLDRTTGDAILDALADLRAGSGLTVLMVTHDERVAERADRVIRLVDGRVVEAAPMTGGSVVPAKSLD